MSHIIQQKPAQQKTFMKTLPDSIHICHIAFSPEMNSSLISTFSKNRKTRMCKNQDKKAEPLAPQERVTNSGNSKHRMAEVKGLETQKGERDCWKDIKTRPWKGLCQAVQVWAWFYWWWGTNQREGAISEGIHFRKIIQAPWQRMFWSGRSDGEMEQDMLV